MNRLKRFGYALMVLALVLWTSLAGAGNTRYGGVQINCVNAVESFPGLDPTGVSDSSAGLNTAITRLAGTGQAVCLEPGTYLVNSTVPISSNTILWANPGVTFKSTLTPSGGSFANSVFYASVAYPGPSTTLASTPTKGSKTFALTSATGFAIGQTVFVLAAASTGLNVQQFTIENLVGTTVTTDDPLVFSFASGDTVRQGIPPTNIQLIGNGANISGTGDRAIELAFANNSVIDGWNITSQYGSFTTGGTSFDSGGRDNVMRRVNVDGAGVTSFCTSIESNVRTTVEKERCLNAGSQGYWIAGSVDGSLDDSSAIGAATYGANLTIAGAGDVDGTQRYKVTRSVFQQNQYGIYLQAPCTATIADTTASYNTTNGLVVHKGSAASGVVAQVTDFTATDNTTAAVEWADSGHTVEGVNWTLDRSGNGVSFDGSGTLALSGVYATDIGLASGGDMLAVGSGGGGIDVTISHARMTVTASSTQHVEFLNMSGTGSILNLDDCVLNVTGGSGNRDFAEIEAVGNLRFSRDRVIGSGGRLGIYVGGVAAVVRTLQGNDFTAASSPLTVGSGLFNRGNVTTTTAVSFPLTAQEQILLQPNASTSAAYVSSRTNGSGFTITAAASTDYVVQ